jgi:hypothetical protein
MTPDETFGQLLRLGIAWHMVKARLEVSSSTLVLKDHETVAVWPDQSPPADTTVTCHESEIDGKGNPQVGVDGLGTMCDGHGSRDEVGAARHPRAEGCRGGQEAVPKLVRLGAGDEWTNRRTAGPDGPSRSDARRAFGENLGPLDSMADDRLHGGAQQLVLRPERLSPRVPNGGIHDRYSLLC